MSLTLYVLSSRAWLDFLVEVFCKLDGLDMEKEKDRDWRLGLEVFVIDRES